MFTPDSAGPGDTMLSLCAGLTSTELPLRLRYGMSMSLWIRGVRTYPHCAGGFFSADRALCDLGG